MTSTPDLPNLLDKATLSTGYLQALLDKSGPYPWKCIAGANSHFFEGTLIADDCGALALVHGTTWPTDRDEPWFEDGFTPSNTASLMTLAPDLAAEVIRLRAENARLREATRRDTIADAVRACQVYAEWCQNWGRHDNLLAAMDAASEIAEMLPRLPEIRHIEDDEEAAKAIYSIDPKWIAEQAKARAALKGEM